MVMKFSIEIIAKFFLWSSVIILLWTSVLDFAVDGVGLETYAMYFLVAIILFFVMLKLNTNPSMIWNFPIVSVIYIAVEFFNILNYSFFPATLFFPVYCIVFSMNLIFSLVIIRKYSIRFDINASKAPLVVFLTLLAVIIGYWIQKLAYDGVL